MKTFYARNRLEWRRWLQKHGASTKEVWLVYYKRSSGKPRVEYGDAVEEAICFGWIDGMLKKIDEERYMQRFTPRNPRSQWSAINIGRARKMVAAGAMTAAGLSVFDVKRTKPKPSTPEALPQELQHELESHGEAWRGFQQFPPFYQRMTIRWIAAAKKPETQQKRLQQLISTAAQGKRIKFM